MSAASQAAPLVQRASHGQRDLWMVHRLFPDVPSANVNIAMRLREPVDEKTMRDALVALVERHEALRTTFRGEGDICLQVIAPHANGVRLDVSDLTDVPAEERARALEHLKLQDACRPFDLEHGPLLRSRLVCLGDDEHVLVLIFHHIIVDFASINVISRDLAELYQATAERRPAHLPQLRIQYVDYSAWQEKLLDAPETAAALAHLSKRLAGTPVLHLMPTRPRPAGNSAEGGHVVARWDEEFVDRVAGLGRACGATFFMTVLAAYAALLSRYSGISDVSIGSPVAGRTSKELEDVVGYFINTLVLRVDVSGDPTFGDLLVRARHTALDALANQHVPYELVVDTVRPERAPTEAPLVQVALNHLTQPAQEIDSSSGRWEEFANGTAIYDLFLIVSEERSGTEVRLQYRHGLLPEPVARGMLGQLRALLEGAIADPGAPVSHLPLVPPEREAIDIGRHVGGPAKGGERTLDELVALRAEAMPDAAAVVVDGSTLSYGELDQRANLLAGELLARSIGHGSLVAIEADGAEFVVAALAVWKTGAAYVPLDPQPADTDYTERLAGADVRVILAQETAAAGRQSMPEVVPIRDVERVVPERAEPVRGRSRPADAAVVFGSRAEVRSSVAVGHRQLVACAQGIVERVPVRPRATHACLGPQTTPTTTALLCAALLTGGCLRFLPVAVAVDPSALVAELREHPVDYTRFTVWQLASTLRCAPEALSSVVRQGLIVGGGPVPRSLARAVVNRVGEGVEVVALDTCAQSVLPSFAASARHEAAGDAPQLPLGRPLAECRAYVLDEARRPVPPGVQGELYVGGAAVPSTGAPALADLIPDPWAPEADASMWATGERVIALPNGSLELLGKRQSQAAVRGFPVELHLVELAVTDHPDVVMAAVVPHVEGGERQLLAYVVRGPASSIDADRVRAALALRLSPYLVPSAIVALDSVPLTPHGDLDWSALPSPSAGARRLPARTSTEQILADIWAQVLGRAHVDVTESFFALGGDSIRCMRMCAKAAEHGLIVSAIDVFAHPTIADLAPRVLTADDNSASGGEEAEIPLTAAQRRRLDPRHRHVALAAVPLARVEESLARLADRHDALRLVVRRDDVGWRQEFGDQLSAVSAHAEASGVRIVGDGALLDEWSWTKLLVELAAGEHPDTPPESVVAALSRQTLAADEPPLVEGGPRCHAHTAAAVDLDAPRSALGVDLVDLVVAALGSAWRQGDRLLLEVADIERVVGDTQAACRPLGRLARDARLAVAAGGPPDDTILRTVKEALRALASDPDASLTALPDASLTVLPVLPAAIRDLDEQSGPVVAPLEVRVRADQRNVELTLCGIAATWPQGTLDGLTDRTVAALGAIVDACAALDQRVYTPSDFPDAGLSQDQLDGLLRRIAPAAGDAPGTR